MTVHYDCTRKEWRSGRALLAVPQLAKAKAKRTARHALVRWALFIVLSVIFFSLMRKNPSARSVTPAPDSQTLWGLYAAIGGLVCFVAAMRLLRVVNWIQFRESRRDVSFTFLPDGILETRPAIRSHLKWARFQGFAENERVMVLREPVSQGMIIPKRLFNIMELEEVRQLLGSNLVIPIPSLAHGFEVGPL